MLVWFSLYFLVIFDSVYTLSSTMTIVIKVLCSSLNRNGPRKLMCLNAWPIGSGTINRRYDLIGARVSLWGLTLRPLTLKLGLVKHSLLLLLADQDGDLSAFSLVPCL